MAPDAAVDHGDKQCQAAHFDIVGELRPLGLPPDADGADDVGQLLCALAGAVLDLLHYWHLCLQNSPFVVVG